MPDQDDTQVLSPVDFIDSSHIGPTGLLLSDKPIDDFLASNNPERKLSRKDSGLPYSMQVQKGCLTLFYRKVLNEGAFSKLRLRQLLGLNESQQRNGWKKFVLVKVIDLKEMLTYMETFNDALKSAKLEAEITGIFFEKLGLIESASEIVFFHDEERQKCEIRMPYLQGMDLVDWDLNLLTPKDHMQIFMQLLKQIKILYELGYVHRDIKPENIRVYRKTDGTFQVVLFDFGLALKQKIENHLVIPVGTKEYIPLYILNSNSPYFCNPQNLDTDLYSFAMSAMELLWGSGTIQKAVYDHLLKRTKFYNIIDFPEKFALVPRNCDQNLEPFFDFISRLILNEPPTSPTTLQGLDLLITNLEKIYQDYLINKTNSRECTVCCVS